MTTINEVTQAHTIATSITGNLPSFGFTVFWTVKEGTWEKSLMQDWAKELPESIRACLVPNDLVSSFESATNLEGNFKRPVARLPHEPDNLNAYWTSRKMKSTSTERLLLRETLDATGKRVSVLNVGSITLNTNTGSVTLNPVSDTNALPDESISQFQESLTELVQSIGDEIATRSTDIEDQKIRTGIQKWVVERCGVALRGRGGVYFIPHTKRKDPTYRSTLVSEILAIQKFLTGNGIGMIFAVEMLQTETFSKDDLIEAVLEEINTETNELMTEISSNPNPNKRKLAAQVGKSSELREKVAILNATLNNKFTHIGIKLGQTNNALVQMLQEIEK